MSRIRKQAIRFLLVSFCLLLVSGCTSGTAASEKTSLIPKSVTPTVIESPQAVPTSTPITEKMIAAGIVKHMTLDQKLGQMVIVEFYGSGLNADLQAMVQQDAISGVLIENKNGNAQSREQLAGLNKGMQGQARVPLLISTDYEGGVVNELRQITGEKTSDAVIGQGGDPQVAYNAGQAAAADLSGLGLNLNFMPIVDVLTNASNPGLPQRAFGSSASLVTDMGRAYLKGLTAGGIVGCLKHFPGLGSANVDPHRSLPTMDRSLNTLNQVDLVPYRTMIQEGIVPMVMVTHILNPYLDPTLPTSLSPAVVTGLLRNQLQFQGVIISDTLWMGGISNTYNLAQAAILAIKAGTDLILGPRGLGETQTMLRGLLQAVKSGEISQSQIDASVTRIVLLKLQYKIISHQQGLQLAGMLGGSEQRVQ